MSFFDTPPPREDDFDTAERFERERPGRWLGGVVALESFIGRSDEAAVAVRRLVVFGDGFELDVVAWVRRPRRRRGRFQREILLSPREGSLDDGDSLRPELVRLGVQFPDGAKATNLDERWTISPDAMEPTHGVTPTSGSTSDLEARQTFWVWPTPDRGDVILVCEWPLHRIAESRLTLDGDVLRAAASRAQPVWPDEAPRTHFTLGHRVRTARAFARRERTSSGPASGELRAQETLGADPPPPQDST